MRYEAVWLFIVLGLLLETSLVFVSLWTLLFPVVSLLLLVASLAVKGRKPRRIAGGVSEGVSGVFAALYLLMVLGFVVATFQPIDHWFLGGLAGGLRAYARLGLGLLALLGAILFYGTAHGLGEARVLPAFAGSATHPRTAQGYRVLRDNMLALYLLNAALAIALAMAVEATMVLAYATAAWDPVVLHLARDWVIRYGAVLVGFVLSAVGLAGTALCLRGAKEIGGDQAPILIVAAMLWAMSLLIHAMTAFFPVVPGAIVAVLALSAAARTMSAFYPSRRRLKIWFLALVISGLQFPANFLANRGPDLCASLQPVEPGLSACQTFLGEAGSLVAVLGSVIFGYLFAEYYSQILVALKATKPAAAAGASSR